MLYGNKAGLHCPGCSNNLLQVVHDNHKAQGWLGLQRLIGAVLIVTIIALLIRRWLRASAAQRRAVAPVLVAGCATLAALGWTVVFDLLGDPLGALPANVYFTLMATVPVAVLFVFLQRRLARGMVAGLVVELGGPSASVTCARRSPAPWATRRCSSRSGSRRRSITSTATVSLSSFPTRTAGGARHSSRATDSRSPCCCTTRCSNTTPSS